MAARRCWAVALLCAALAAVAVADGGLGGDIARERAAESKIEAEAAAARAGERRGQTLARSEGREVRERESAEVKRLEKKVESDEALGGGGGRGGDGGAGGASRRVKGEEGEVKDLLKAAEADQEQVRKEEKEAEKLTAEIGDGGRSSKEIEREDRREERAIGEQLKAVERGRDIDEKDSKQEAKDRKRARKDEKNADMLEKKAEKEVAKGDVKASKKDLAKADAARADAGEARAGETKYAYSRAEAEAIAAKKMVEIKEAMDRKRAAYKPDPKYYVYPKWGEPGHWSYEGPPVEATPEQGQGVPEKDRWIVTHEMDPNDELRNPHMVTGPAGDKGKCLGQCAKDCLTLCEKKDSAQGCRRQCEPRCGDTCLLAGFEMGKVQKIEGNRRAKRERPKEPMMPFLGLWTEEREFADPEDWYNWNDEKEGGGGGGGDKDPSQQGPEVKKVEKKMDKECLGECTPRCDKECESGAAEGCEGKCKERCEDDCYIDDSEDREDEAARSEGGGGGGGEEGRSHRPQTRKGKEFFAGEAGQRVAPHDEEMALCLGACAGDCMGKCLHVREIRNVPLSPMDQQELGDWKRPDGSSLSDDEIKHHSQCSHICGKDCFDHCRDETGWRAPGLKPRKVTDPNRYRDMALAVEAQEDAQGGGGGDGGERRTVSRPASVFDDPGWIAGVLTVATIFLIAVRKSIYRLLGFGGPGRGAAMSPLKGNSKR